MADFEYTVDGTIGLMRLNRPEKMNAISYEMLSDIEDAIRRAGTDERVRAVVLTGVGRAFCAGADLAVNTIELDQPAAEAMLAAATGMVTALVNLPMPVVAAVRGGALGVGASLAFAADLVVAADTSYFRLPFLSVGLMPDGGATATIAASVGRARALRMVLRREKLTAPEALSVGLVAHVCPDEDVVSTAEQWARDLANGPRAAQAAAKAAVNAATLGDIHATLAREAQEQVKLVLGNDFAEAVSAFEQRRAPTFGM